MTRTKKPWAIKKRLLVFFSLALFFIVGLPFSTTTPVNADIDEYWHQTSGESENLYKQWGEQGVDGISKRIRSLIYYHAVSACSENALHFIKVPYNDANSLFDSSKYEVGSFLAGADKDGKVKCNGGILVDALKLWEINFEEFLFDTGWYFGAYTKPSTLSEFLSQLDAIKRGEEQSGLVHDHVEKYEGAKLREKTATYISKKVYGGNNPPALTSPETYYFLRGTLDKACVNGLLKYNKKNYPLPKLSDDNKNYPGLLLVSDNTGEFIDASWWIPNKYPFDIEDPKLFESTMMKPGLFIGGSEKKTKKVYIGQVGDDIMQLKGGTKLNNVGQKIAFIECNTLAGTLSSGDINAIQANNAAQRRAIYYAKFVRKANDDGAPRGSFTDPVDDDSSSGSGSGSSCNVEGVGWIVCPVVNFLAKITDSAMGFLERNFLKVEASLLESGGSAQRAWAQVRNIANTFFIITFLIVIFSQLTSFGISNYGIKTMLPRLIIGAILVNLSFVICQLAVDLSNLIGNDVANLLSGIADTIADDELLSVPGLHSIGSGQNKWGNLAGGTLAVVGGGVLLYASLGALIPILLGAVIAVLGILLMLAARKALIVMLTIISPLAFIAYLFPNKSVNNLFSKWQKIFVSLLMLYPIISFVYSGSKLTSQVLTDAYEDTRTNHEEKVDAYNLGQIIAAGVGVLPLFIIPGMLKKSMDGLGKVGATVNGLSGKLQGNAKNKWSNSELAKNMAKNKATKKGIVTGGSYQYSGKNPFKKAQSWRSKAHAGINKHTGSYGYRKASAGDTMAEKQNKEDVEMAAIQLRNKNLPPDDTLKIAMGEGDGKNNIALRQAAIKSVVETGNIDGIEALWDQSLELGDNEKDPKAKMIRSAFANSLMSSSSRSAGLGAGAIAKLESGTLDRDKDTFHGTLRQATLAGAFSPEKLVNEDKDMLEKVRQAVNLEDYNTGDRWRRLDPARRAELQADKTSMENRLREAANQAKSNPNTSVKISKNKEAIDNFATPAP